MDGNGQKAKRALFAPFCAIFALISGSAAISAAAIGAHNLERSFVDRVDLGSWSWLKVTRLGVESRPSATATEVSEDKILRMDQALHSEFAHRHTAALKKSVARISRRAPQVARAPFVIVAPKIQAQVIIEASASELTAIRDVQGMLTHSFTLAMVAPKMSIQVAKAPEAPTAQVAPAATQVKPREVVATADPTRDATEDVAEEDPESDNDRIILSQAAPAPAVLVKTAEPKLTHIRPAPFYDPSVIIPILEKKRVLEKRPVEEKKETKPERAAFVPIVPVRALQPKVNVVHQEISRPTANPIADVIVVSQAVEAKETSTVVAQPPMSAPARVLTPTAAAVTAPAPEPTSATVDHSVDGYSVLAEYSRLAMNTATPTVLSGRGTVAQTPSVPSVPMHHILPPPAPPAPPVHPIHHELAKVLPPVVVQASPTKAASIETPVLKVAPTEMTDESIATVLKQLKERAAAAKATQVPAELPVTPVLNVQKPAQPKQRAVADFIEAFDSEGRSVEGIAERITHEEGGWNIVRAPAHWPTLYWGKPGGVPVLSGNSAQLLATKAGAPLENQAGIVIAHVAAGWTIEISGRAESPIILDTLNQTQATAQMDGERTFIFVNVAPGAQIAYLTRRDGVSAVALPVFAGTVAYADLTQMSRHTFHGRVLDADAESPKPVDKAQVRIVGVPSSAAITSEKGQFRLENVWVAGPYPVFLETEAGTGYTHRYRINPDRHGSITLFRLTDSQITETMGQLQGGVSPESGLVFCAAPALVASYGSDKLTASVRTLAPNATLTPETYSISTTGQLEIRAALNEQSPRFVAVQIADGPAVAQLADASQNVVWSELLVSSPGIVTLLGPY